VRGMMNLARPLPSTPRIIIRKKFKKIVEYGNGYGG
jgi:hypothetical protein